MYNYEYNNNDFFKVTIRRTEERELYFILASSFTVVKKREIRKGDPEYDMLLEYYTRELSAELPKLSGYTGSGYKIPY